MLDMFVYNFLCPLSVFLAFSLPSSDSQRLYTILFVFHSLIVKLKKQNTIKVCRHFSFVCHTRGMMCVCVKDTACLISKWFSFQGRRVIMLYLGMSMYLLRNSSERILQGLNFTRLERYSPMAEIGLELALPPSIQSRNSCGWGIKGYIIDLIRG